MPLASGAAEASDKPSEKEIEKIAAGRKAAKNLELLYQSIGSVGSRGDVLPQQAVVL